MGCPLKTIIEQVEDAQLSLPVVGCFPILDSNSRPNSIILEANSSHVHYPGMNEIMAYSVAKAKNQLTKIIRFFYYCYKNR